MEICQQTFTQLPHKRPLTKLGISEEGGARFFYRDGELKAPQA